MRREKEIVSEKSSFEETIFTKKKILTLKLLKKKKTNKPCRKSSLKVTPQKLKKIKNKTFEFFSFFILFIQ